MDHDVLNFVENSLKKWRDKRNELFLKNHIDTDSVYDNGDFEKLPPDCLMAVCYVDAFATMKHKIETVRRMTGKWERQDVRS